MNYYQYYKSQTPNQKVSSTQVLTSSNSYNTKKVKKSSGCGCGKKKIITEE
ncbi:hypothetical protein [Sutcliffiella halmapala]|uniref:hypothetical protein n=1 Tax=Sutcliffiella halmapala TaxID=79882 RepID=UPI0014743747|nr:hypothetical protein [Sutcliffiella halmapala]